MKSYIILSFLLSTVVSIAAHASYFQGFEDPDWAVNPGSDWDNYAGSDTTLSRQTSGTNGITSASGNAHGFISSGGNGWASVCYLGGYSSSFNGGFSASLDIYINLSDSLISDGNYVFELSTAVNGQDGNHQRDFIYQVNASDEGELYVVASNNAGYNYNPGNDPVNENTYQITDSGWYNFTWNFYENDGLLWADMVLYNSAGNIAFNTTLGGSTEDSIETEVGGNRYMWFAGYNVGDGLAIDNTTLSYNNVPEPSTYAMLLSAGILGFPLLRRRRR